MKTQERMLMGVVVGMVLAVCVAVSPPGAGRVIYCDQRSENPDDGDIDIDNNLAERVLRAVAIGRRNWMFAGSDAGAERAAIVYSLIVTCKLCHVDPFAYLRDVLDRVSTHPASRIVDLTPLGWSRHPPARI